MKYKVEKDPNIIIKTIFSEIIDRSQKEKNVTVALLGGSTIDYVVDYLNENTSIDLDRITFFMGDERLVPIDDSENNSYNFLKNLKVPLTIIRVNTSLDKIAMKNDYLANVKKYTALDGFDFMILGVGNDGHTLSVFPKDLATDIKNKNILDFYCRESDNQKRISFTIPFAIKTKKLFFIALGDSKKEIVKDIIINKNNSLPVTYVLKENKNSILYCDENSGKLLQDAW